MFPEHNKITTGFVIQVYATLPNGSLVCIGQTFHAGDPVEYEDFDGTPVEVDVTKEVYCPLDMKQPKQIPDEKDAVKFVCSSCGDTRIEACMQGCHTTAIEGMFKSGSVEYGDTESTGELDRFQCVGCGKTIKNDNDEEPICEDDDLIEWCKNNCEQK
jgi:predicted RNA-binding Zn-ribbon protein involved in translation (DUF1610 family)